MKRLSVCAAILAALPALASAQVSVNTSVEFKLQNVNSGLLLGVTDASQAAGANVLQWADNGTADHLWHFIQMGYTSSGYPQYHIVNVNSFQMLEVSGASTSNGAQIDQWPDTNNANQLWTVSQAEDGNYLIVNVNSGKYLEVHKANNSGGEGSKELDKKNKPTEIDQRSMRDCNCQEWVLEDTGVQPNAQIAVDDSSEFKLQNVNSGLVLGIAGANQAAGTDVIQWGDNGTSDHLWHFIPMGYTSSGYPQYNIENMDTHQLMGVQYASTANGAPIVQWADNGTADHLWTVTQGADGNYQLTNVNSGKLLEVYAADKSDTATIDQWSSTGCSCQEWALENTETSPYPSPRAVSGSGIYVHDPYMLKDAGGTYWLYGTHNTLAKSTDGSTFTNVSPDFSSEPSWWTTIFAPSQGSPDMWAPSLLYANGTYYQYYAVPVVPDSLGGEAVIALATSPSPNGPWNDKGVIISSWSNSSTPTINGFGFTNTTTYNAIDPAPFIDASGNWWLVFGSWFDGTHVVALDPSTGLLKTPGQNVTQNQTTVAFRWWGEEGPFIYPYNGYYYYFAPINPCCQGVNSTYRIIVGRSTSPTGPFYDRGGINLLYGGGTILLSSHLNVNGPGGQSVFTDNGNTILVYHYYDGFNNGTPTVGINQLGWTSDGWPYVE